MSSETRKRIGALKANQAAKKESCTSQQKDLENLVEDLRDYKATREFEETVRRAYFESDSSSITEGASEGNETWEQHGEENLDEIDLFDHEGEADHDDFFHDQNENEYSDEIVVDPRGPGFIHEEEAIEQEQLEAQTKNHCHSYWIIYVVLFSVLSLSTSIVLLIILLTKENRPNEPFRPTRNDSIKPIKS